jgi:hypothetical protein
VAFEERRDGRVLWRGTGSRAEGDANINDVCALKLTRLPQTPQQTALFVEASTGHLNFAAGEASFMDLRVLQLAGGLLTAPQAVFSEAQQTLQGSGPIVFRSPTAVAYATSFVAHLADGRVEFCGPVQGVLLPSHASHEEPALPSP